MYAPSWLGCCPFALNPTALTHSLFQTTKLGQAYGVCVILVTFITTSMVSLVALIIWRLPILVVLFGFLVFGLLDGLYLSSALTKVPDGAWFTLVLAGILSSIFLLWRFGKENQWRAEASDRIHPTHILTLYEGKGTDGDSPKNGAGAHHGLRLTPSFGGAVISSIRGMGIFFDKTGSISSAPTVFVHFLQKFQAAPTVVIFFHIRTLSVPTVPLEDRFTITRAFPGSDASPALQYFFRITLRHGYTDEVVTRDLGILLFDQIRNFVIREQSASSSSQSPSTSALDATKEESDPSTKTSSSSPGANPTAITPLLQQQELARQHLSALDRAYQDQVVYVVGKEQMRIHEEDGLKGWPRRIALSAFLWLRNNTGSRVANLNVDVEKLVEVGFVKVV